MTPFIIVAYYTAGTGYKAEAAKLEASLRLFGIDYLIDEVPNLGSWQKNTQFKAHFLLWKFDDPRVAGRPIVYVDADAIFLAYPSLFDSLDVDCAFAFLDQSKYYRTPRPRKELVSSTIYLKNNEATRELIMAWIAENELYPDVWDQKNLQRVLDRQAAGLRIAGLPETYFKIFDTMRAVRDPVIEQYQKSRIYRRQIDRWTGPSERQPFRVITTHDIH
jgi:hypothetical protein